VEEAWEEPRMKVKRQNLGRVRKILEYYSQYAKKSKYAICPIEKKTFSPC
jgi:hypothetical protein